MNRRPLEASWEKVVEQAHDLPPDRAEVVIKHVAATLLDSHRRGTFLAIWRGEDMRRPWTSARRRGTFLTPAIAQATLANYPAMMRCDDWIVLMNEVSNERGELEPRFQLLVMEPPLRGDPNFHDGPHPARPGECARCDVLEGRKP